jgi:hypothetical protein
MPEVRTAWGVTGCLLVVTVIMFVGPGETFSAGDLSRIRSAEAQLASACRRPPNPTRAAQAISTLRTYLERDPDQPLPLHGAGPATSMRSEMLQIEHAVASGGCSRIVALRAALERMVTAG